MRTDSLFYRLFQDWPELVLELAGLETPAAGYVLRAEEIKQTGFRLDGVLAPPDDRPDGPLVFIETQFQQIRTFTPAGSRNCSCICTGGRRAGLGGR
jgi:predicted transposase YdaD